MNIPLHVLPQVYGAKLHRMELSALEEIRLRVGQPLLLSFSNHEEKIHPLLRHEDLEETLRRACRQSVYAREQEIRSVFSGMGYAGILTESADGSTDETLVVYDASGNKVFTKQVGISCQQAEFSRKGVLLYNSSQCVILNRSGKIRYEGGLDGSIVKLVQVSDGDYMQIGETEIKRITLR